MRQALAPTSRRGESSAALCAAVASSLGDDAPLLPPCQTVVPPPTVSQTPFPGWLWYLQMVRPCLYDLLLSLLPPLHRSPSPASRRLLCPPHQYSPPSSSSSSCLLVLLGRPLAAGPGLLDGREPLDQHGVGVVVGRVPGVGVHVRQVLQLQLYQPTRQLVAIAQRDRELVRLVL